MRIPVNGGDLNTWIAKQVLDLGVYGVIWPHVSTVEEARNAVASCRYPRPPSRPYYEPAGHRGDAPRHAARYWGLTQQEYYERADVWPLIRRASPRSDHVRGGARHQNLPKILEEVPGIGVVIIGEGDLSQDMGFRANTITRRAAAIDDILAICKEHNVVCGHPHVDHGNVEQSWRRAFAGSCRPPSSRSAPSTAA